MGSRVPRLLRGTLLGGIATTLAALSHTWAGGTVPSFLALLLGGIFASVVGTIFVGTKTRTSLLRTATGVGIAQAAFHGIFSTLSTGASLGEYGHHHAQIVLTPGVTERGGEVLWMWLAHFAAAALTIAYLHRLEKQLWMLLGRASAKVLPALREIKLVTPGTVLPIFYQAERLPNNLSSSGFLLLRGPPAPAK